MKREPGVYRVSVSIKRAGFKTNKVSGLVAVNRATDTEELKRMARGRYESLLADITEDVSIEVGDVKRVRSTFFLTL